MEIQQILLAVKNYQKELWEVLRSETFEELDRFSLLRDFDQINLVFRLLIFLLIFANSADFDGCRKLINRKEKNITFFEIPEINLKI